MQHAKVQTLKAQANTRFSLYSMVNQKKEEYLDIHDRACTIGLEDIYFPDFIIKYSQQSSGSVEILEPCEEQSR